MKIVGKIFAILFSIIYCLALTCLMIVAFLSNVVSKNYYANIFENINFETIKVADLGGIFDTERYDNDATLEDVVVQFITEQDVDDAKVKALVNDNKVRKEAGKIIGSILSYAMGGEKPQITREEIKSILNSSTVTDIIGIPTNENIDYIYNEINKAIEEMEGGINDRNSKRNSNNIEIYR